jgi:hypothetical protein
MVVSTPTIPQTQSTPWVRFWLPLSFLVYFLGGILLAAPSLSNYWFNDDLMMIRIHTNEELVDAFQGNWEPSGISTPGYRPLTTVFNHITALAFGEAVELHRLFRIGLFAAFLTVLASIGRMLGMSHWGAFLAGLLVLFTKNTWWVLTWPADGIRAFTGLLWALSALLLLDYLRQRGAWKLVLSLTLFVIALLTREDMLIGGVLTPMLALAFLGQRTGEFQLVGLLKPLRSPEGRIVIVYTLLMGLLVGVAWLLRMQFVVGSQTALSMAGWVWSLLWVFVPRLPFVPIVIWLAIMVIFWAALVLMARALPITEKRLALFWLACTIIAAAPGLVITRANTILLPICFFCLLLATLSDSLIKIGGRQRRMTVVLLAVYIVEGAVLHRSAQLSIALNSTEHVRETSLYFWGEWQPALRFIPQTRRDYLSQYLATLEIGSWEDYESRTPELVSAGILFEPSDDWLSGW